MFKRLLCSIGVIATMGGSSLQADMLAYELTGSHQFGTIDLNTGGFTVIKNDQGLQLSGLGVASGALYGGLFAGNTLYQVDPSTGAITVAGTGSVNYYSFGSNLSGLYAVGTDSNLYSISPSGAATLVGPTGLGIPGASVGMSSNSSTLYFTDGPNLYTLNTSTGAATLVGGTGVNRIGGMVFEGGSLWAGENSPPLSVYTLNTTTGQGTFVANESGTTVGFWGLAPSPLPAVSGVPEPASWSLLATVGLGWLLARKRKRLN